MEKTEQPSGPATTSDEKTTAPSQSAFYHNLVPAYEALWPAVARRRILATLEKLNIPDGAEVLEVGVGTGLSLESYPRTAKITGVDLSEPMLAEAEVRIAEQGWDHIKVMPMNAEDLKFEDSSFDIVTSFHTLTVVNEPQKMMSELVRVCRPGGMILVINHFRSKNPLIARVVDSAGKVTKRLGWRTDVKLEELVDDLPIRLDDRYKSHPFSLFTVLKATAKPDHETSDK